MNNKWITMSIAAAGLIVAVAFQNCGQKGLSTNDLINVACAEGGCSETITFSDDSTPGLSATSSSQLYNFVAGSKAACENSIANAQGVLATCTKGGGCGVSCGKPQGSCVSANPTAYGACLSRSEILASPRVADPTASSTLFNFVAGSKATCENSIAQSKGILATCSVGGGCGISCGKPSGTCASANPSHYGACLSQTDIDGAPKTSDPVPSTQFFNFVAGGGKAACEDLIATHKGVRLSCSLGGGCGISCGKPSTSCVSANPSHYGACVSQADINAAPKVSVSPTPIPSSELFNFVAGSKVDCEKSIGTSRGKVGVCKVGGGCGVSCGKPSTSCVSANPTHFGACYSSADLAALPTYTPPAPSSQLYNFVAGTKAACEQSVKDRLGKSVSCTKGGGCGVSCGMPSASCRSANPTSFGACVSN